jgi:hypothetical protein
MGRDVECLMVGVWTDYWRDFGRATATSVANRHQEVPAYLRLQVPNRYDQKNERVDAADGTCVYSLCLVDDGPTLRYIVGMYIGGEYQGVG